MIEGLEITPHYFGDDVSYVLVRMDVGKMPPQRVKQYLDRARSEMKLFKLLDEREIDYDIVGVRNNSSGLSVEPKVKPVTQEMKEQFIDLTEKKERRVFTVEVDDEDSVSIRQKLIKAMAAVSNKEVTNSTVLADRNDILKTTLADNIDLKKDSFADAMKLID